MKKPCKRYLAGYCKFQLLCNFSHYNEKQLKQLEEIGASLELVEICIIFHITSFVLQ